MAAAEVFRLNFIRHARELGFEVDAIRELLTLASSWTAPAPTSIRSPEGTSLR